MSENNRQQMTDFDSMVSTEPVQILKAVIPYVPPRGQRILSLYAKVRELQNTMSIFRERPRELSICSAPSTGTPPSPMEMINDIRGYCSPSMQQKLDECINMIAMVQMMELFQENDQ